MWEQHTYGLEIGLRVSRRAYDASLPSLLCVHGAGGQGMLFRAQLSGLAREANLAAIDLPGHGDSPGPSYESIEDYAGWLADFIECGPIRPIVLGHSMGGAIAQTLAVNRPELISGLVLAATGARLKVSPALMENFRNDYEKACADLVSMAYSSAANPALLRQAKEELLATPLEVVLADFGACDRFDLRESLSLISQPTLLVVGTHDRMTPVKYSTYLESNISNAKLEIIEGAGHGLYLEKPNPFNQAVREFLSEFKHKLAPRK